MFPNVNGFSWTPLHIVFLAIFFTLLLVIAAALALAAWRSRRDLKLGHAAEIEWHAAFEDLPASDRACRHEFTGEFRERRCDRGFDCRRCATHASLIGNGPAEGTGEYHVCGLHYPGDRLYHRGHTWVQPQADGTVLIGPDDLSRRMLGRVQQLQLPPRGARIQLNGTAWVLRQCGDEFRVLSPVDGEVLDQGGPDDGYYLRVRPAGGDRELVHLLRGAEVRPWVLRELERIQILISPDPAMPALADGGVLVDDASETFPQANWPAVWGQMLLEP